MIPLERGSELSPGALVLPYSNFDTNKQSKTGHTCLLVCHSVRSAVRKDRVSHAIGRYEEDGPLSGSGTLAATQNSLTCLCYPSHTYVNDRLQWELAWLAWLGYTA